MRSCTYRNDMISKPTAQWKMIKKKTERCLLVITEDAFVSGKSHVKTHDNINAQYVSC